MSIYSNVMITDTYQLDIARSLAPLSALRILKVHFDFPGMPGPMIDRLRWDPYFWAEEHPEGFERKLRETTVIFAQSLSPCLRQVCYFQYNIFQLQWRICHLDHGEDDAAHTTGFVPSSDVPYETEVRNL